MRSERAWVMFSWGLCLTCASDPGPGPMVVEMDDLVIGAGDVTSVDVTTTFMVANNVDISGRLVAAGDSGQSIEIVAGGDITISGEIVGGRGAALGDGGTLMITSTGGSIRVTDSAQLTAGDGGETPSSSRDTAGGAGGQGGHIILSAASGAIDIANKAGVLKTGSGGGGQEIVAPDVATAPEGIMTNAGGDGGAIVLSGQSVSVTTATVAAFYEIRGPQGPLFAVDMVFTTLGPDALTLQDGGDGGDAGNTTIGVMGQGLRARQQGLRTSRVPPPLPEIDIEGARGGRSFFANAGDGGDVRARGRSGAVPGQAGQSVDLLGGQGGLTAAVVFGRFIGGRPGEGGSCIAIAGDGADGAVPSGPGGAGGDATCSIGATGLTAQDRPFGTATAEGGQGGNGGEGCSVAARGGAGGEGGSGSVSPSGGPPAVRLSPRPGGGGDGGDGEPPGSGGSAGLAFIEGDRMSELEPDDGEDGAMCPGPDAGVNLDAGSAMPDSGAVEPDGGEPRLVEVTCAPAQIAFENRQVGDRIVLNLDRVNQTCDASTMGNGTIEIEFLGGDIFDAMIRVVVNGATVEQIFNPGPRPGQAGPITDLEPNLPVVLSLNFPGSTAIIEVRFRFSDTGLNDISVGFPE